MVPEGRCLGGAGWGCPRVPGDRRSGLGRGPHQLDGRPPRRGRPVERLLPVERERRGDLVGRGGHIDLHASYTYILVDGFDSRSGLLPSSHRRSRDYTRCRRSVNYDTPGCRYTRGGDGRRPAGAAGRIADATGGSVRCRGCLFTTYPTSPGQRQVRRHPDAVAGSAWSQAEAGADRRSRRRRRVGGGPGRTCPAGRGAQLRAGRHPATGHQPHAAAKCPFDGRTGTDTDHARSLSSPVPAAVGRRRTPWSAAQVIGADRGYADHRFACPGWTVVGR
jgi:hypothetical protein